MHSLEEIVEQVNQHPNLVVAEDYELCVQKTACREKRFHNGLEIQQQIENGVWIGLRILHRKQPGRSAVTTTSPEAIRWLVESAFESAERSAVDPWFRFPIWKSSLQKPLSEKSPVDPSFYESLYPVLVQKPTGLEEAYRTEEIETGLFRKTEKFSLHCRQEVHQVRFSVSGIVEERAKSQPIREKKDWLGELLGMAAQFQTAEEAKFTKNDRLAVSPRVGTALLREMKDWFLADRQRSGTSPIRATLNDTVFSSAITLIDDGSLEKSPVASAFDMEGAPTQETTILDKGVLKSFLYCTYYATQENRLSTGNFVRTARKGFPALAATALYIRPSTGTSDVTKEMGEGYYLEYLDRLEPIQKTEASFQLVASGWRIKNGMFVEPVRNLAFKIDLRELFRRAVHVGQDLTFFGQFGTPSILFEKVPLEI